MGQIITFSYKHVITLLTSLPSINIILTWHWPQGCPIKTQLPKKKMKLALDWLSLPLVSIAAAH